MNTNANVTPLTITVTLPASIPLRGFGGAQAAARLADWENPSESIIFLVQYAANVISGRFNSEGTIVLPDGTRREATKEELMEQRREKLQEIALGIMPERRGGGRIPTAVDPLAPYVETLLKMRAKSLSLRFGLKLDERLAAIDGIEVMLERFAAAALEKGGVEPTKASIAEKVAMLRGPVLAAARRAKEASDELSF